MPDAQADGWTGAGVKIAVIDTQINPDLPVFADTDLTVADPVCPGSSPTSTKPTEGAVHGSDVTALLIGNGTGKRQVRGIAPDAHVTFYGVADCPVDVDDGPAPIYRAIEQAVTSGAQVISLSMTSTANSSDDIKVIADAEKAGVVIVAGSPNSADDDQEVWPWGFNGVVSVNAFGKDGKLQNDEDIPGKRVAWAETTVVAPGVNFPSVDWSGGRFAITGSSLATPLTAGIIAVTAQKYPKATGNQLIQSLIHNTTPDDHTLSPSDTGAGYGPVSLRHMLRVDPTRYPDKNPLMDKSSGTPTAAQIARAGGSSTADPTPSATATEVATASSSDAASAGGIPLPLLISIGVAALLIIAAIAVVLVLALRRRTRHDRM